MTVILLPALAATGTEWRIQDAGYQTLGFIDEDNRILDTDYEVIGYIESDRVKDEDYKILARLEQGEEILVKNISYVTQYYIELGEEDTGRLKDKRFGIIAYFDGGRITNDDDEILAYYDHDDLDTPEEMEGMPGENAILFLLYFSDIFD
ncbi:MAG: hypothetical protein A2Y64_09105 [Candidatus Coatesbacteria bacterium RBG_13_66_14]|uniref:Uncharacterized protein n=1 Tax=Candidatus Coatesbacteria bacterium RBG_13_66_14 TaxID=1817816 RepID=A0A1F5F682_9BACT|nr:MAG: hypothetical protein A2Y64_09105 [Candidatus Coatesbacteria bacterium RBG_13_66_14]